MKFTAKDCNLDLFIRLFVCGIVVFVVWGMEEAGQIKRALIDATAGAISGAVSRTVTSPLDVIKIRFQVERGF